MSFKENQMSMRQLLNNFIAGLARRILAKYKPKIIGITGSIGKTSAKEAVFLVVSQKYRARKSEKNFNNELGLPLAVIGVGEPPGRSAFAWLKVFTKALWQILFKVKYPEVLVLEMGVDRPGDMDYLLSIVRPDVAVITGIGVSHYEFFKDTEAIEAEKSKIARAVEPPGFLILNADNQAALRQKQKNKAKVLTYGIKQKADVQLSKVSEQLQGKAASHLQVATPSGEINFSIKALGEPHQSASVCAVAAGLALNMEKDLIAKGLGQYKPTPGRLNIISGIKHSLIIDDTYNSAPDSAKAALSLLGRIPGQRKFAVLGDMLELGALSDSAHEELGKLAASFNLSHLFAVGAGGKIIASAAKAAGMSQDRVLSFDAADEARASVQRLLLPESLILIKGSQGMRMEKITQEIMSEPARAHELLCRQYGKWLN